MAWTQHPMDKMITYVDEQGRLRIDVWMNGQLHNRLYIEGTAVFSMVNVPIEEVLEYIKVHPEKLEHIVGFRGTNNIPDNEESEVE